MSLISDALRKARREASPGLGDSGRSAMGSIVVPRRRSRVGTGLVIGAAIALGAGALGAAAVWWLLGGNGSSGDQPRQAVAEEVRTGIADDRSARPGASPAPVAAEPSPPPADRPAVMEPDRGLAAAPPPHSQGFGRRAQATPEAGDVAAVNERPLETPATTARAVATRGRATSDRVFVVDADVGYARLSLDYIVFRSDDPYAEINGLEVHVGSRVSGFVVSEITRDRVVLRDDRGPLTLRAP